MSPFARTVDFLRFVPGFLAALAAAQDTPVIRVDTRLVQVDVIVKNGKGPVSGLTQDDFTLLENGKRQKISLFKVTEESKARDIAEPLPPGVVSNRVKASGDTPQSVTVVLLDRLNTSTLVQPYASRQLLRFLQSARKGDQIAIYVLGQRIRVIQDFTTDLDRLIKAASRINPDLPTDINSLEMIAELREAGADPSPLGELQTFANTDRATRTSAAMAVIARHLAGVPGRKNLVWISSSFPLVIVERGFRIDFLTELRRATRMLNEANVAVYPVDARGLMVGNLLRGGRGVVHPDNRVLEGVDTMNAVAGLTGGQAYYNTNDLTGAIRQAVEDATVTYTLGFYPPEEALDGTFHDLRVKVAKRGVDVRHRKGYFAARQPAPNEQQRREAFRDLLGSPLDSTAVGLTAGAEGEFGRPGNYRLSVAVNVNDLRLERRENELHQALWAGSIAVGFHFETAKSGDSPVLTIPISLTEDQLKAALQYGFVVRQLIDTSGASGRLRVIVQDQATGAAGSIWVPLGKADSDNRREP